MNSRLIVSAYRGRAKMYLEATAGLVVDAFIAAGGEHVVDLVEVAAPDHTRMTPQALCAWLREKAS